MTYFKATRTSKWRSGGESATAECQQVDECEWEILGYVNLREATRQAEDHVLQTGNTVEVERAQFRFISPVPA